MLALPARAEVDRHARHAGEQHEQVGADRQRELGRAAVLVDDARHAVEPGRRRATTGIPPPPPAITTRAAPASSVRPASCSSTSTRPRARRPCAASRGPASGATSQPRSLGQPAAPRLVVERADRLGRRCANAGSSRSTSDARRAASAVGSDGSTPRERRLRAGSRSGPGSSRSARRAAARGASRSPSACWSISAPTCGPLPCVSTTSWPRRVQRDDHLARDLARVGAAARSQVPALALRGSGRCPRWR